MCRVGSLLQRIEKRPTQRRATREAGLKHMEKLHVVPTLSSFKRRHLTPN